MPRVPPERCAATQPFRTTATSTPDRYQDRPRRRGQRSDCTKSVYGPASDGITSAIVSCLSMPPKTLCVRATPVRALNALSPGSDSVKVVLTRKLADAMAGVDVSACHIGDVLELPARDAQMLMAEGWATPDRRTAHSAAPETDRRCRRYSARMHEQGC